MNKKKTEEIVNKTINSLESVIKETDKMFDENKFSRAYIVGYLQGAITTAINNLKPITHEEAFKNNNSED